MVFASERQVLNTFRTLGKVRGTYKIWMGPTRLWSITCSTCRARLGADIDRDEFACNIRSPAAEHGYRNESVEGSV